MILRDVEISLTRFIFNEIPIHLIYLPQTKLVDRGEVFKHFLIEVENITEERIQKRCEEETLDRHRAIDDMVKETIRYAIFSHRWLNEGEPSYHQMTAKRYMLKSLQLGLGYKKLKAFCREAEAYGLQFAWSDTCCIDKTSSSELDESIRSMFRWYRNSTICIAYLAASQNVETLAEDVWFTRGWTLQELLAPLRIKFYGKDWARLTEAANDLEHIEILQQIEKATTISIPFLQYHQFEPGPINIAERMGWAANRTTSRGEDSAYCLMGIFGVSLSPAYGEGADQAFFRLTEAIIQVSNNPDILNWAGSPAYTSHPTRMLPSSPARYLGRPKLQVIHSPQSLMLTNRGLQLLLLVINAQISKDSSTKAGHANTDSDFGI
ncbi:hypothetical protein BDQ12DRAFT_752979 [Crucibulum laeve]|uniref:Heterokaryon incompatibility domain-containing protein n=1 Tax=Crucibulum laeve TaxID=68775 RepID=A0A5C3MEY0_9AGAR|nr:hypothetical protein BDQ12DRAFT_752979 [Crucibulum laeve]